MALGIPPLKPAVAQDTNRAIHELSLSKVSILGNPAVKWSSPQCVMNLTRLSWLFGPALTRCRRSLRTLGRKSRPTSY